MTWRGELLAELVLSEVEDFTVLKRPKDSPDQFPFDFVVSTKSGLCFFVEVKSFSSMRMKRDPRNVPDWELRVDTRVARNARTSLNPVVAFLFDADANFGRYLQLDTLPEPEAGTETVVLTFPIENTITAESLKQLAAELERSRRVLAG